MCDWPDCRKSFLHAENLTLHRRQHTEPKPFRCEECPLAYWQKSSLRSHRLKAHGPTQHNANKSAQLLASVSSAGQLVDGIIKSVTASMQAGTSCHGDNDASDLRRSLLLAPGSADDPDLGYQVTADQHLSTELGHEAGTQPTQQDTKEVTEQVGSGVTASVVDHAEEQQESRNPWKSSEPLNVYEFCEDETVDICRPKPSRGTAVTQRTTIDLPQHNIELKNDSDDDDDDHDLMAFDDDATPTIDRLSETVITYSRKKKRSVENETETGKYRSKRPSADVKTTTKKSRKQRSPSVAGLRQKRSAVVEVPEVSAETAKKKVWRKRAAESGEVEGDVGALKQRSRGGKLTKQTSRSRRSKKEKTSADRVVQGDDCRSNKSPVDGDLDAPTSPNSATLDGRKQTGPSDSGSKLESVRTASADHPDVSVVRNVDVHYNGLEHSDLDMTSADTDAANQVVRKTDKGRRRRTRGQKGSSKDGEKDLGVGPEADMIAEPRRSQLENTNDDGDDVSNRGEMELKLLMTVLCLVALMLSVHTRTLYLITVSLVS